jgi:SAM-dependent methyltransferase
MTYKHIKADLVTVYNQQAEERDKWEIDDWKAEERKQFLSLLQEENKRSLLEIGAGPGRDSLFFKEQGFQVTCIDLSPKMIELCRQKGLDAQVMDMNHLDLEQESFDAVYALNSFLHLPKDKFPTVSKNVHDVLCPSGLFYLGMYGGIEFEGTNEKDPYTPNRFFSFHSDENLKRILAETFDILYFKRIDFEKERLSFQSTVLRKCTEE